MVSPAFSTVSEEIDNSSLPLFLIPIMLILNFYEYQALQSNGPPNLWEWKSQTWHNFHPVLCNRECDPHCNGLSYCYFSFGSFETFFCALDKAAKINVRPPTRPKNISRIKTLRESRFSSGVIPRDRPTVPTAEAVSKRQVSMGSPSETLMIRPPVQHSVIYISEIVAAFLRHHHQCDVQRGWHFLCAER